jgi:leucyl aminopeptidase
LVFEEFKGTTATKPKVRQLAVSASPAAASRAIKWSLDLSASVNYARRLAAMPPNVATTQRIAAEARRLARANRGLTCRVIQGRALETNRLVGLIAVGKASENKPCLIQLTYVPRGRAAGCVLLIGKTICYDTGGLNLKTMEQMKGMKYDKSGGLAVLGAMHAAGRLRPRCKVVALLPTAENSISDEAQRPDDILTYPNGVTVEVTNTDAEGRLILADALAYGCKRIKPDAIIDVATLTGGIVVALGRACAGLWCEDDALRARIESAARSADERLWRMPLFDDYKEMMKSKHADIWNSAPVRDAHPIQGAAFLSYFVDPKIPWGHIDIAGVADVDKDKPPFAIGPTGFGVRLLATLLHQWK